MLTASWPGHVPHLDGIKNPTAEQDLCEEFRQAITAVAARIALESQVKRFT